MAQCTGRVSPAKSGRIMPMKYFSQVFGIVVLLLLLAGCQLLPIPVYILADGEWVTIKTSQRVPSSILSEAGILPGPGDRILYQGNSISPDSAIPGNEPITLSIRRIKVLTVNTPDGRSWTITSSAETIGEAFAEDGLVLYSSDRLEPSAETPLSGNLSVFWQPAVDLTIDIDGNRFQVRSAAGTIGNALGDSGFPLIGLDYSVPPENEPLPVDGQIRITRVAENVSLEMKSLPFGTRTEFSADLEIDQQGLLQGGETGLAIARVRTRSEDGKQVAQVTESESIVRPPQDQVLGIGTKIVIRSTVVDGVTIEYWRALNLFATVFIPDGEHKGTASGTLIRKGSVAMVYPWYLLFAGENLYIPGYGYGTVEDNNGALTNALGGTYWVDLGYSLEDVIDWSNRYVTVYFLTPVPANVADTYLLP
jgi:uncharacterized protein YabE (DUF348 family)